jgi:hypothetical protein
MFAITVSDRDVATFIIPETCLLAKDNVEASSENLIARLEQYASSAECSNIAKAVEDTLCAETEGIDGDRLGKALVQIAISNPFTVHV